MFPLLQKSFIFEFLQKKKQKTLQFLDKLNWESSAHYVGGAAEG